MSVGIQGVSAVQSRVAQIESRLGIGATGSDNRAERSFDEVLASHTTSETTRSALPRTTGTPALDRLMEHLAVPVTSSATGGSSLTGVPYAELFETAGQRHGVDPALLASVADAESGYDPTAVSHAGAEGLMQLMPATAAGLGVTDSFDPVQAVDGAARLLAGHLDRFGSVDLALAAYNAGPGAVARFGGIPPYEETQRYVPKVLQRYQELSS